MQIAPTKRSSIDKTARRVFIIRVFLDNHAIVDRFFNFKTFYISRNHPFDSMI